MRRRLALVALALISLGTGLLASPTPAGAASLVQSGWWYRAQTGDTGTFLPDATPAIPGGAPVAPVIIPAPATPTVAEGSVLVEGTPEGATAVAALRWTFSEGEIAPMLTLTPSDSSNVPADAVILACRSAVEWKAPEKSPGAWEDKPLVDCGASVQGIANPDGSIAFGLGPLVSGSTLDIVLTPGLAQSQPTPVGSSFSLSFAVADGAVLTTDVPAAPAGAPPAAPVPSASLGGFSTPTSAYSPPAAVTPVAAPSLPPEAQAPTVPQQTALPATRAGAKDDNGPRGVAFLILLAGLACAGLAYISPARAKDGTIGLGRFKRPLPAEALTTPTEPVPGGLGRFVRPRTGPPPALS